VKERQSARGRERAREERERERREREREGREREREVTQRERGERGETERKTDRETEREKEREKERERERERDRQREREHLIQSEALGQIANILRHNRTFIRVNKTKHHKTECVLLL
jgi:hypothetical protein